MKAYFDECPRCGSQSYESFKTHSHCVICNYSPMIDEQNEESAIPAWAVQALESSTVIYLEDYLNRKISKRVAQVDEAA